MQLDTDRMSRLGSCCCFLLLHHLQGGWLIPWRWPVCADGCRRRLRGGLHVWRHRTSSRRCGGHLGLHACAYRRLNVWRHRPCARRSRLRLRLGRPGGGGPMRRRGASARRRIGPFGLCARGYRGSYMRRQLAPACFVGWIVIRHDSRMSVASLPSARYTFLAGSAIDSSRNRS